MNRSQAAARSEADRRRREAKARAEQAKAEAKSRAAANKGFADDPAKFGQSSASAKPKSPGRLSGRPSRFGQSPAKKAGIVDTTDLSPGPMGRKPAGFDLDAFFKEADKGFSPVESIATPPQGYGQGQLDQQQEARQQEAQRYQQPDGTTLPPRFGGYGDIQRPPLPPGIQDRSRLAAGIVDTTDLPPGIQGRRAAGTVDTTDLPPGIQNRRSAGIVDTTDLPPGIQDRSRLAPTAPPPPGIQDRGRLAPAPSQGYGIGQLAQQREAIPTPGFDLDAFFKEADTPAPKKTGVDLDSFFRGADQVGAGQTTKEDMLLGLEEGKKFTKPQLTPAQIAAIKSGSLDPRTLENVDSSNFGKFGQFVRSWEGQDEQRAKVAAHAAKVKAKKEAAERVAAMKAAEPPPRQTPQQIVESNRVAREAMVSNPPQPGPAVTPPPPTPPVAPTPPAVPPPPVAPPPATGPVGIPTPEADPVQTLSEDTKESADIAAQFGLNDPEVRESQKDLIQQIIAESEDLGAEGTRNIDLPEVTRSPLEGQLEASFLDQIRGGFTGDDPVTQARLADFKANADEARLQQIEDLQRFGVLGGGGVSAGSTADVLGGFDADVLRGRDAARAGGIEDFRNAILPLATDFSSDQANRAQQQRQFEGGFNLDRLGLQQDIADRSLARRMPLTGPTGDEVFQESIRQGDRDYGQRDRREQSELSRIDEDRARDSALFNERVTEERRFLDDQRRFDEGMDFDVRDQQSRVSRIDEDRARDSALFQERTTEGQKFAEDKRRFDEALDLDVRDIEMREDITEQQKTTMIADRIAKSKRDVEAEQLHRERITEGTRFAEDKRRFDDALDLDIRDIEMREDITAEQKTTMIADRIAKSKRDVEAEQLFRERTPEDTRFAKEEARLDKQDRYAEAGIFNLIESNDDLDRAQKDKFYRDLGVEPPGGTDLDGLTKVEFDEKIKAIQDDPNLTQLEKDQDISTLRKKRDADRVRR